MPQKVVIFNFSPRIDGNCSNIATYISIYHNSAVVTQFHITAENCQPCAGCNYECLTPGSACPTKSDFLVQAMDAACSSDAIYYIVPNFCGYPNANYFAFNERFVGYFGMNRELRSKYINVPKKFIIVSNTESEQFKAAMQQQTNAEPDMLYLKTSQYKKRSTAGDLMESLDAKNDLKAFLF